MYTDPYVKIEVYIKCFLVFKKRTKVEKRTLSPKFRKTFSIQVPGDSLARDTKLILTVKHVAKLRKKHIIGHLCFGTEAKSSTLEHWDMIHKRNDYVEMWHDLEPPNCKLPASSKVNYLLFEDNNSDDDCLSSVEYSDHSYYHSDSVLLGHSPSY